MSKATQLGRLRFAKEIGAEILLSACPKCFLHFNCARADIPPDTEPVQVQDIFTFLAASLLPLKPDAAAEAAQAEKTEA